MTSKIGFTKIVNDAKSRIQEIEVDEVKKLLTSDDRVIILDVREDSEWNAGHIPTASHLCKGIIERDIEKLVPDYEQKLLLYCGGGNRSALVADNLQKMGYQQVLSMVGGFSAWKAEGFPIVKD